LLAASIVANTRPEIRAKLRAWREARTADVLANTTIKSS
jgi:phosphoribosylcarboxyaminoimidazole (NCAIR) mutase